MSKAWKRVRFLAVWALVAASFVVIAGYLIVLASGYQVNFKAREIQKTAILIVRSTPRDAVVYINGKALDDKTPLRRAGLLPGLYDIKIEKAGHQTWQRSLQIEEGLVYDFDNVVLFLETPAVETIEGGTLPEFAVDSQLFVDDGEIFYRDKLVTRLSQDIKHAVVYPDRAHVAFQVDSEIRIVDVDGSNNTLLVKLDTSEVVRFGFQDEDTLLYQEGSVVKRAKIL